jgi:23S rRNA pseudouridine2605 synthase
MAHTPNERMRLQKYLSDAGVASRRRSEELILEGRVLVNDRVIDQLPAFVDPQQDRVVANGVPVRRQRNEYFIVHKPKGVVCTNRDPAGRIGQSTCCRHSAPAVPVGRLDADSTGLLLMTNDGELGQQITHPRFGVPKTYRAEVKGRVPTDLPAKLKQGVYLAEGRAQASQVEIVHAARERSVLMITLREGRNRQVRRMLARLGFPVKTLKRVQIGTLSLKGLPVGAARRLSDKELANLRREVRDAAASAPRRRADDGAPPPNRNAVRAARPPPGGVRRRPCGHAPAPADRLSRGAAADRIV